MNKHMNWGTKLVIGMLCFMCMIVVLGVLMVTSQNDTLVENDYYEKGIHYDTDYNKKEQVKVDHADPVFELKADTLLITFVKQAEGTIKFIRISDKTMDRVYAVNTNSLNQLKLPVQTKAKGLWKLRLDWKSEGKKYLYEKEVMLP
jgi:hypothetical protein